jgi:hypothetical protein
MAFLHGKGTRVLHGAYDLTTYLNEASVSHDVEANETTTFQSSGSAKTYVVGLRDAAVSASGLFDGSSDAIDQVLTASIGSDSLAPITIAPDGFTVGNGVVIALAKTTSYEVSSPVADVVSVSYDAQTDGGADRAVSLAALASVSSTGNGTSVDNSASSTGGGIAQVHVTVNTRSAATTLKVQHSADNSTWADLATFTSVTSTQVTSERVAVSGTVNRYLRATHTIASGTGALTYQASFARR